MVLLAASLDVLLPYCLGIARDSRFAERHGWARSVAGYLFSIIQHCALGFSRFTASSPPRALRFRFVRLLRMARCCSHLPFLHTRLACFCSPRMLYSALRRRSRCEHDSFTLFRAPMTTPATPNHALQRTPGFGVQLPRAAVVRPAQSRAVLPSMKPGTARAFALRRSAHSRAPGPESLSLGSLGVFTRHL